MAAKREDMHTLLRGLTEFPVDVVRQAHAFLTSGSLYRSEKCEGVARWLLDLHERRASTKKDAPAPVHATAVRSERRQHRTSREDRRRAQKRRRTRAPLRQGGGSRNDMDASARRRSRRTKDPATSVAPPTVITWVKFCATVLPTAESIEFLVPNGRQPYLAHVTAKNADAPPMLQWDRAGRRNPVSIYAYTSGSLPEQWNLKSGQYHRVTAVTLRPWMWDPERSFDHQGKGVCFILHQAWDTTHEAGGGMFPEWTKSEYHGVRKTLEAHFRGATIEGREAAACGISPRREPLQPETSSSASLRVACARATRWTAGTESSVEDGGAGALPPKNAADRGVRLCGGTAIQ